MYRSYNYESSSFYSTRDEYIESLNMIQRRPSMIADTSRFPNTHEVLNNQPMYVEENYYHHKINNQPMYVEENYDHHKKKNNDHHKKKKSDKKKNQKQSPESHKKVHFVDEKKGEEKSIDAEADGFIQQKRKGFEF